LTLLQGFDDQRDTQMRRENDIELVESAEDVMQVFWALEKPLGLVATRARRRHA
jgi:hypothetical protein